MASSVDLLLLVTQPPYRGTLNKEQLDLLLVSATLGQKTSVVFWQQGILQLLPKQQPSLLQARDLQASLQALGLYDVDQVYLDQQALARYACPVDTLGLNATPIDTTGLQQLIQQTRNLLVM